MHAEPLIANKLPQAGKLAAFADQTGFHASLARYNQTRLAPGIGDATERSSLEEQRFRDREIGFVERIRAQIAPLAAHIPSDPAGFVAWFESLRETGPGQGDPLFPWLAEKASSSQMRWFLEQEVGGEAGFDDLVAMTQVKMPTRAKLEMARNYWDEMGRGDEKGMHGPMLERLAAHFHIHVEIANTVDEALALGNMMMALAFNRRYAFHSVGALGAIEMTAPERASFVVQALDRLGVPKKQSHYFSLHSVLDVKHSRAWNSEVLWTLVSEDGRRARAMGEGALLRLWCGQQCFLRYRKEFALS